MGPLRKILVRNFMNQHEPVWKIRAKSPDNGSDQLVSDQLSVEHGLDKNFRPFIFGPRIGSNKIRTKISDRRINSDRNSYVDGPKE